MNLPFKIQDKPTWISWLRDRLDIRTIVRKSHGGMVFTKALEIAIDKSSASSSELLAASLKDQGRARIVGEKSYGKGSVQVPKGLKSVEGVKALITTYHWYRPSGGSIEATRGLVPDYPL